MKKLLKSIIPQSIRTPLFSSYHLVLAWISSIIYRHPSRSIYVVGVTGTKGKTTTVELIRSILEHAGHKVATTSTLHFTIAGEEIPNKYKMSMPGRFFMQQFLRRAVTADCTYAILEMTSEGARQHRHRFIDLDAFLFTNLSPEHIESHGSYNEYRKAKLSIGTQLERSTKNDKVLIVNGDDKEALRFLGFHVPNKFSYKKQQAEPIEYTNRGITLTYEGYRIPTNLKGVFDVYNALAAITFAKSQHISVQLVAHSLNLYKGTRGRMEYVHRKNKQHPFSVLVDYAHTPDSLSQVYESVQGKKICVLGATGGGRDMWKRPEFGKIAQAYCDAIFLTNEDPYDENPEQIIDEIAAGITGDAYNKILNRRDAIHKALSVAPTDSTVIITGKGTDPYIMGAYGNKEEWDDATVAREELAKQKYENT
ncbi:MAG: Mur ligase family protein [bacterium]|nr:Mur ligase family protein [bacterium]